ncbi:MAG TPA: hypothetical protein VF591_00745 [Pyrinomonadaceae bacterium]
MTTSKPAVGTKADAARSRSEVATLVFAASVAVALGVACGFWINARMASAAGRAARSRPAPDAPAPAGETGNIRAPVETADATAASKEPAAASVEARPPKPAATPAAREVSRRPKVEVRPGTRWEVEKSSASQSEERRAAPCALYASAGSLTLRGGGGAPLVLGGPGEAGRVNVSTPDWSNIAVLYEGRTGNGWLRYSVRSFSGRPGLYAVRFATPCGSKTIPVTVK